MTGLACVVLAAGMGKRMNSSVPKVLNRLCGKPMLQYVIEALDKLKPDKKVVVAGKHHEDIKNSITGKGIAYVLQEKPLGTGHALLKAAEFLTGFKGTVLVLNGDMPLITPGMLRRFIANSKKNGDLVSVLSFIAEDPASYGRIVRDSAGSAIRIIEDKDAAPGQKAIKEVNSGVYAMSSEALKLLPLIKINKAKGEYYLTDILELAARKNLKPGVYASSSDMELMGINNRSELMKAEGIMQARIINKLAEGGVNFTDTRAVYINAGVSIGRDTMIYPNVFIEGETKIGSSCTLYPNVRIINSLVGNKVKIKDSSLIEDSVIRHEAQVGPFAHLRPGSDIGRCAKIGNFVEVKKSIIGPGTKVSHLSYIGDASVGKEVNIGAGTITCNYDGKQKHLTEIKDMVFIGSDTQLVAPVCIGKGAYIGAGSTIVKDVPPMSLAVSRSEQKIIKNWAAKRKAIGDRRKAKVQSRRDRK